MQRMPRKIAGALGAVLGLAAAGSLAFLWTTWQSRAMVESLVTDNVASVRAAEELEIALLEQKGLVANFILDEGDETWLDILQTRETAFRRWLDEAQRAATTPREAELTAQLAAVYAQFDARRDEVVALHRAGQVEAARRILLDDVQALYGRAYDLCEGYLEANEAAIAGRIDAGEGRADRFRWLALGYVALVCAAAGAVGLFVARGIFAPLGQLIRDAGGQETRDAVRDVGATVHSLMTDVSETRSDLERSRQQLLDSEKLASVGKLAASVAHEIRNPLTSMKMRLFYLRGEVGADPRYEEDFRVVSEEVSRLESVVRNVLEFSRPPDLRPQAHAVDDLLDRTLALCRHRLDGLDVDIERPPHADLPAVWADAEQTMQVFLNLILNAAEAMPGGGRLTLSAHPTVTGVRVEFGDAGGGVPDDLRDRIFEPFFSTKEEGTGLGLAIAARIMERQGGGLGLTRTSPAGTVFHVDLPAAGSA